MCFVRSILFWFLFHLNSIYKSAQKNICLLNQWIEIELDSSRPVSRRSRAMQQHLIKNVCISVKAGWCSLQINRRSSFRSLPMCSQWWLDWKTTTVRQTGQRQSEPCRLCVCSWGRINRAQSDILSYAVRQCTVQPCIQEWCLLFCVAL